MKKLFANHRYEALGLAIALVVCAFHGWSMTRPVQVRADSESRGSKPATRFVDSLLQGLHNLEGRATDIQFKLRGPMKPHPDVVIAAVDEKSAQKYGLWPWKRSLVAKGIENLNKAGAKAIGLDMIFTDQTQDAAHDAYTDVLKRLTTIEGLDENDQVKLASFRKEIEARAAMVPDVALAKSLKESQQTVQGVMLYSEESLSEFQDKVQEQIGILAPHVIKDFPLDMGSDLEGQARLELPLEKVKVFRQYAAQTPLKIFADSGNRLGFFTIVPDPDGTLRRTPAFARLDGAKGLLPNLELQTAAAYFGTHVEPLYDKKEGLVGAYLARKDGPPITVPLDPDEPFALINHMGDQSVFKTLSLSDIIDGTFNPKDVEGKALLVGVTLLGNFDQRVTPYSEFEPGIYTHASYLSNILQGDFLRRSSHSATLYEILFMLVCAVAIGFFLPRFRFALKLVAILGLIGAYLAFDQMLFARGTHLATTMPVLNVLLCSFGVLFLGYLTADREKGQLRSAFQHYLNASVMEQMLANPDKLKLGGEKKEMTVMFSDIRGFTTLSERMVPEALVKFINSYLTPMTNIVFDEKGTLDKYIGDAVMAFWGAPLDQADHAVRACRAAVRMYEKLRELKVQWRDQNLPEFDIGVGINSGQMIVGNMGSDVRFDYTVMGDSVNLASRLEGTNKEYETRILISESTYLLAKDHVVARRLGAVRVKGKRKPVRIYELRDMGVPQGKELEAITTFEKGVDLFADQKFEEAAQCFTQVLGIWENDPPSRRYLDEIEVFKSQPPGPGWDGVYTATSK